jgi:DNA-binding NarL/FixJ family response regulator
MPKPEKVLIVDDEPHVRDYISLLVQSSLNAPQVLKAADSTEALAHYTSARPDLVLLDINMVGETGFEILRQLRQLDPQAVVVMLTTVNVRRSVEEARALGAKGYILKDMPYDDLARVLQELVAQIWGGREPTAA